jgi:YHS domain-containing protein
MMRHIVLLSGVVAALGLSSAAWAANAAYPRPCPNNCTPNTGNFGYFPTTWRQWPGEQRLEQINPQAIGKEVLPTPQGHEHMPTPPAAPQQQQQQQQQQLPPVTPEGEPVPPGGAILPPQSEGMPLEPPGKLPGGTTLPGLPGLPVEPSKGPPIGLPGIEAPKSKKQSTPTEQPKPPANNKVPAKTQREATNRTASMTTPFQQREITRNATVLLPEEQSPFATHAVQPAHRAESIVTTPPASSHDADAAAYASVESDESARAAATQPAKTNVLQPSAAIGGYCPVELVTNGRWARGDQRWTAAYNGCIYKFSGSNQRQQFLSNPEAFIPACSGADAVLTVDEQRAVPGQVAYCAMYNGRLYMFSNATTQMQFNKNPQRYAVGN